MKIRNLVTIPLYSYFIFANPVLEAANITQGAMLSNSCAACHGTHGKSPGAIPSINGKSASFIANTLKDFRSGKRPSTVMGRHARGYTDLEIQQIAEFFSSVK
jgi:sulfide dehydrogenase cytochrome subunit